MFKLQRPNRRQYKSRERVDFKFSNFQALQVLKGWDRLFLLIVSPETGKTIAKLGKGIVRNASCQWTETVTDSIWMSRDDSSKELEECLLKFILYTGSTRSSIIGEATINLAQYTCSKASSTLSQPLEKCSYETIFLVKVQCLSPRLKIRDGEKRNSISQEKDLDAVHQEICQKWDVSDYPSKSRRPIQDLAATSHPLESDGKETSRSASGPYNSFDSLEIREGKQTSLSARNSLNSAEFSLSGKSVKHSCEMSPVPETHSSSASNCSSLNSRMYFREDSQNETSAIRTSSITNSGSYKNLLEAAEDAIEELRVEAKMWERNARKLMIELDMSRKEFSDLSKKQAGLEMELSTSNAECDGLKREVEQLKEEVQKLERKHENSIIQSGSVSIEKVLESEMKYQQDLNANLFLQLKQSQESNIELVSVLQELEQTIEQQKIEIESLSLKTEFTVLEASISSRLEDNGVLMFKLDQIQESEKKLLDRVWFLEEALREKNNELENEWMSNNELLSREKDYKNKISLQEEEIVRLDERLSSYLKEGSKNEDNAENPIREIELLKEKIQDLEKDCSELTDENLELLFKLKELNKTDMRKCRSFDSMSSEHLTVSRSDESEVSDPKDQISHSEEELEKNVNVQKAGFENCEGILEQVRSAHRLLVEPWSGFAFSDASQECDDFICEVLDKIKETATKEGSVECIHNYMLKLNKLLETRIAEFKEILSRRGIEIDERSGVIAAAKQKMEEYVLEIQEHEQLMEKTRLRYENLVVELDERKSELNLVEAKLISKEEENRCLLQNQKNLEDEINKLQQEKSHLEHNMNLLLMEKSITSESLDNLRNDFTVLHNTVDFHVSSKAILEKKLEEVESKRNELEINVLGLQEEKHRLQECVVVLESQLKNDKDFCLQDSKSVLQKEISEVKVEMEAEILNLNGKSEEIQKQLLEAQEMSENLKAENQILQKAAENLSKDAVNLENAILELNSENQQLHQHRSLLVSQLSLSEKNLSDCEKKIELMENHLTSVVKDFSLREKNIKSEIDALLEENINQEQKFDVYMEKIKELENLHKEIECLTIKISVVHEENKQISFEMSQLLNEKTELQVSHQEAQSRAQLMKNELEILRLEYESLMADHERLGKLLASYKKSEDKLKTDLNELELKLTISEYERLQLAKEMGTLKVELQSISGLRDEISAFKDELEECRLEKERLEMVLGDYEELKAEKILLSEKICSLQNVIAEFEECRRRNSSLEEKILELDNELSEKEVLSTQNNDLKNELSEAKRVSVQFQQKIYTLEMEKDECLKKIKSYEERLESMKEHNFQKEDHKFHVESPQTIGVNHLTEASESWDTNDKNIISRESNISADQCNGVTERYERTKSSLETELSNLRERYLEMSLKYAEVEAEREDLVMKLKATRSGKRWF